MFKQNRSILYYVSIVTILLYLFYSPNVLAQDNSYDDFGLSLKDLFDLELTTASKKAEKVNEIPASVVILTRKDIEQAGYFSLGEILMNIPGLYMMNNMVNTTFGVRGSVSKQNQNIIFLVNGVKQKDDTSNSNYMHEINVPVEAIDRIEVIRGPMSIIYGSAAFFGAINIITNQVNEEDTLDMVSCSYGTKNSKRLFVRSSSKGDNHSLVLNASTYGTDGLDVPYRDMVKPDLLSSYLNLGMIPDADMTSRKRLEQANDYIAASGTFNDFYFDISLNKSDTEMLLAALPVDEGTEYQTRTTRTAMGLRKEISSSVSIDGVFVYRTRDANRHYDTMTPDFYGHEATTSDSYEIELDAFIEPNEAVEIISGIYYHAVRDFWTRSDIPVGGLDNWITNLEDNDHVRNFATFMQADFTPLKKLKVVGGIRLEKMLEYTLHFERNNTGIPSNPLFQKGTLDVSDTDTEVISRLALLYSINDSNTIKFLYGQAIRHPSVAVNHERSANMYEGMYTEDLDSEKIDTMEINHIFTYRKIATNFSIFRNNLKDLIIRDTRVNPSTATFTVLNSNGGELVTNGAELTLMMEPTYNFHIRLSGTYQDTEDQNQKSIDVAYSPNFLGYSEIRYRYNDIVTSLSGNYIDEMEAYYDSTAVDSTTGLPAPQRIGDKTDSYYLLNAGFRVDDIYNGLFLDVNIFNLLDEEIRYPTPADNDMLGKGAIGPGRMIYATVGFKF